MANMKFANNANTTLASSLTAIATSMSVTSATKFPVLNPLAPVPEYFYCTLTDVATQTVIEIVKVTVTTGTTWTITRGQDGTTGTAFAAGDVVSLRLVKASLNLFPILNEANTFTGTNTFSTPLAATNMTQSSGSTSGYLSSTDWTTFNNKTSNTGTVTSVAASVPSFLSISGSPITTSGTLAITLSGTALPTTSGGTGLTSFTANGVAYASSSSALATGSTFKFDGTNVGIGASTIEAQLQVLGASGTGGEIRIGTSGADLGTSTLNMYGYTNQILFKHKNIGTTLAGIAGYPGNFGTDSSGYMTFSTQTAAGAYAERMRIFGSGGVSIGNTTDPGATNLSVTGTGKFGTTVGVGAATPSTSGAGITFPATASLSTNANTLDDYEEGTWTPMISENGAGIKPFTATSAVGKYTKIGNTVIAYCSYAYSNKGIGNNGFYSFLTGYPYSTANTTGHAYVTIMQGAADTNQYAINISQDQSGFVKNNDVSGAGAMIKSAFPASGTVVFTVCYST